MADAVITSILKYWLSLAVFRKVLKPPCFSLCPAPGLLCFWGHSSLPTSFGLGANSIPQLLCLTLPDRGIFLWLFGRLCPRHLSDDLLRTQGDLTADQWDGYRAKQLGNSGSPTRVQAVASPRSRVMGETGGAAIAPRQRRWQESSARERSCQPTRLPNSVLQEFQWTEHLPQMLLGPSHQYIVRKKKSYLLENAVHLFHWQGNY